MVGEKSWLPTRKWFATQTVAILAFAAAVVQAGDWNKTITISLLGLLGQMIAGYLYPNADTPGGVPVKT